MFQEGKDHHMMLTEESLTMKIVFFLLFAVYISRLNTLLF